MNVLISEFTEEIRREYGHGIAEKFYGRYATDEIVTFVDAMKVLDKIIEERSQTKPQVVQVQRPLIKIKSACSCGRSKC